MNNLVQSNDANKKISILELPAENGSAVEYYIDAAYVGGVAADDLLNAVSSAMVFRGTFTAVSEIPTPAAGVLGDVYKFVTDDKDGVSITLPGETTAVTLKRGDIIICAKTGTNTFRWAVVPAGDTDGVLEISKGTAIKLYNKAGNEVDTLDREGSIGVDLTVTDGHHHDIIFTGTHSHEFTGNQATISVTANPTGTVTLSKDKTASANSLLYTPEGSVTITCTPAGSVSTTATEETKTAPVSGALSSVTIADHTIPYVSGFEETKFTGTQGTINTEYTPEGTIAIGISSEAGDGKVAYKPEGTIGELTFTGHQATLNIPNAVSDVTIDDHETFKVATSASGSFTGTPATISFGSYTPTGEVDATWAMTGNNHADSTHTFNGSQATISSEGTASVTTTKAVVTGITTTTEATTVANGAFVTSVGSIETSTADVLDSVYFAQDTTNSKKLKMFTSTNAAVTGASISGTTRANAITSVTPTTETVTSTGTVSASASYKPAGTITTQALEITGTVGATFTGSAKDISTTYTPAGSVSVSLTKEDVTLTHTRHLDKTGVTVTHTPSGSISTPVFTGTTKYFSATFTGTPGTGTGTFTPSGNLSIVPVINKTAISHGVETGTAGVTATYKCLKDLSSTFTGTEHSHTVNLAGTSVYFNAGFAGDSETLSTSYTPAGTVEDTTLTFTGETGNGCRQTHTSSN